MADVRPPKKTVYDYGQFKTLPGTSGPAGVPDTFYGPRNKAYADFIARQTTRLRGHNAFYYVLEDHARRIDGDRPNSNAENSGRITVPEGTPQDVFARKRHAGSALYGENIVVKRTLDSVRREVQPDWPFLDPIMVRGLLDNVEHEQEPDERGSIWVRRADFYLARVLCDREWEFQPRPGDVIRLQKLADQFLDIEDVSRDDESRFGGDGFFVSYKLILVKSSKYEPQRKIAEQKLVTESAPDGSVDDPSPGGLS